jgi:prepilin-type N-terminal cleavage/methylation domain-containing protein
VRERVVRQFGFSSLSVIRGQEPLTRCRPHVHRAARRGKASPMKRRAFTIIELLVVISIIALLIGILLPAISKARESAKLTESLTNLKNMGAAHQNYAAQWNDRQFTIAADNLGAYGSVANYNTQVGEHPGVALGWGSGADEGFWGYWMDLPGNHTLVYPINPADGFGWFRIPNCKYFSEYVNGKFYDRTWYAPKDKLVLDVVEEYFDWPGEYVPSATVNGGNAGWSSYCLSPAALFAPKVMDADGFTHPFSVAGGFKCPSMSQARHSDLKSHMLEHHWLQGTRNIGCNPSFENGTFNGCEPYYFNHGYESAPATLFYDGSVRVLGIREAGDGDNQARVGNNEGGLYFRPSKDPDEMQGMQQLASDGYFLGAAYDFSAGAGFYETGFHILTKDGILGRDTLGTP